jgi:predicted ATPase
MSSAGEGKLRAADPGPALGHRGSAYVHTERSGRGRRLGSSGPQRPPHELSIAGPGIITPDRRVRVFVSSTMGELAADRLAARSAIVRLHLTPVMFEGGARPHPARELYRAYLAQSDVFVGIYWQSYGWVAPSESVSGLEDEYLLSGDRPKLIYVKAGSDRDLRLADLLERIRADDRVAYKHFNDAEDLVELLADDLAVLLTERFTDVDATAGFLPGTLPTPPTDIIGREHEILAVGALLRDPAVHLVTLLGPGGIGKTRLALEAARELDDTVPADLDGVSFIDLAAVGDASLWPDAVVAALGIRPEGSRPVLDLLIDRLQGRRLLLVLDNVEQLVPAASDLAALLAACPELTVLVTSRIVLQLRGEREVSLTPLPTPAADASNDASADCEAIGGSPAVQLLVARARQVRPRFALTPANAAAVAELCRRLDGIPLALELAAAQLRLLTPAALIRRLGEQLDRPLDLAGYAADLPDRQRTLRATIEWSYSLLGEAERLLFARLSVFTGSWTMEATESVGTVDGDLDALETTASLVAQSLIRTDESDPEEVRFRMLDTIRAYAGERLAERGETAATNYRLAHYLVGMVETVRDALQGAHYRAASERLDRERDDIRSAIDWALRNDDAETVGRLLTPLFTYWWSRGLLPVTHDLAERAARLPSATKMPPYAAALLSGARGMAMVMVGQPVEAEPLLLDTITTAAALGNDRLRAYALLGLAGAVAQRAGDDACRRLGEAAELFHAIGDLWGLALTLSTHGQLALAAGEPTRASRMHLEALAAAEMIDNDHLRAQILDMLGLDAVGVGDLAGARQRYTEAAALHTRLIDYEGSAYGLSGLAGLAIALDRPEASARLIGASVQARDVVGVTRWPGAALMEDHRNAAVAAVLDPSTYAHARADGARMPIREALAYGLAVTAVDGLPAWSLPNNA